MLKKIVPLSVAPFEGKQILSGQSDVPWRCTHETKCILFIYLFKFYDMNTYIRQKQIYINAKELAHFQQVKKTVPRTECVTFSTRSKLVHLQIKNLSRSIC